MSNPRFYFPDTLQPHRRFPMPDALAHYALRVLRLKNEADIVVFDGSGGEYPARLNIEGKQAFILTGDHTPREAELAGQITLAQGLPSASKMDWIIEKAVELGAQRVTPIAAQRSVLQLRGERLDKRMMHWQRVAQAASEQCGRNRIMVVDHPVTVRDYLQKADAPSATLLCHPDYGTDLTEAVQKLKKALPEQGGRPALHLMIGPEGGWSDDELALARECGIQPVRFGARILRTETAGLALIAAVTALLGWN